MVGLWLLACLVALPSYADLKTDVDQLIINKSAEDKTLTNQEKLFDHRCDMIAKYLGFSDTPTGKATKYSCDVPAVGIAFYAGKDLGKHPPEKITQYIQNELSKHNVKSKAFIKHNHNHGSSVAFYINGESWLTMPLDPLESVKKVEALAAETKLILFTAGRIKTWPKSVKSQ